MKSDAYLINLHYLHTPTIGIEKFFISLIVK